jgi:hypothetical protein
MALGSPRQGGHLRSCRGSSHYPLWDGLRWLFSFQKLPPEKKRPRGAIAQLAGATPYSKGPPVASSGQERSRNTQMVVALNCTHGSASGNDHLDAANISLRRKNRGVIERHLTGRDIGHEILSLFLALNRTRAERS